MDPIGIIEENYFSLTFPRACDSTAPNMPAALREAGEWLEGEPLITLEAHDALHPEENDE